MQEVGFRPRRPNARHLRRSNNKLNGEQGQLLTCDEKQMKKNGQGAIQETAFTAGSDGPRLEQLWTVEEVANLFQVPPSWVYDRTRRRGQEQLPHLKLGKYLRFQEYAVRQFLERQRRN